MALISKKVCMVGPFAVGKTSLVNRFVTSIFSEKYHTTIGVKISKKQVEIDTTHVQLMLWDIEGVDVFTELRPSYLRGAAGIILVVDGTRSATLGQIDYLIEMVRKQLGNIPLTILINKADLETEWKVESDTIEHYQKEGYQVFTTSAKTGDSVDEAFHSLARHILHSMDSD